MHKVLKKKITLVMLFDSNYLAKAIVAYRSLMKYYKNFDLYAFCFDDLSYEVINKLKCENLIALSYKEFENKQLLKVKAEKKRYYEYYWTCIPYLTKKAMEYSGTDFVIYVDADIMFFSNPKELFNIKKSVDIVVQPNNFSANEAWQFGPVGYYCGGWTGFRNNKSGRKALDWWHERCMEWCYAKFEDNKFGGQKYLDDWKTRFKNVQEVTEIGACIAPWNVGKYDALYKHNKIYLNGKWLLIYYHFHSFRMNLSNYKYIITGDRHNNYTISPEIEDLIYKPYIDNMKSVIEDLKKIENYQKYTEYNPEGIYKTKG